jgi:hypothetical protein
MTYRLALLGLFCCVLSACGAIRTTGPVINSGSYDWTDQVRDARGFPLPGWGNAIFGGGGFGDGPR